ncbi:PI31 proteasome regulator [Pochonia chlamydosporia 170]|uniref:PI31 proteasome regulator n=1 Tax=Pochonia chlamydosporia 170 TaxID=1380566 RepID=A0A179FUG2_METCM|nr:PI31 proteasome regulator [Pochonia chlamydosporia 170]OAQ68830.1 PI31 proteasome regulator [Pochonia chlamydosporia 170]
MASTLTVGAVLQAMADALPTHQPGDDSSDLASSYEAIALLVHAYLAALNFRLCGFDQDKPICKQGDEKRPDLPNTLTKTSLKAECESLAPRLPPAWNSGFGSLSFVYKHKQSSMQFVFRIDRMGSKVEVRGLAVGDENIHRFDRTVRDVVDSSALPIRISMDQGQDRSNLVEKLRRAFVSENAISDMLNDLKVKIVQKLIPKLQREGYVETADAEETARSERRAQEAQNPRRPYNPTVDPNIPYNPQGPLPEMARPRPGAPVGDFPLPGFEDEYEMLRPHPRGPVVMPGGRHPLNIGHDDLNPPGLGPHDPLRGSFVPGGLPHPGAPGGMHPTFDDPLFTGQGQGGMGGPGAYDPQAPPGARWDPVMPGGAPRFPGQGQGRGNGPFGGSGDGGFGGGFGGGHII